MTDDDIIGYIANLLAFNHELFPTNVKRDARVALSALRHLGFVDIDTFLQVTRNMMEQQELLEQLESTIRSIEEHHEAERIAWQTKENPV